MGNLIVATSSIFVPILTKTFTYPYIMHPYRWGGLPWEEPGIFAQGAVTKMLNFGTIMTLAAISNMMNSVKTCHKVDLWLSYRRSIFALIGYIVGQLVAYFVPMVKAPIVGFLTWLPYAGYIADGLITFPFILFFGSMGTAKIRSDICGDGMKVATGIHI